MSEDNQCAQEQIEEDVRKEAFYAEKLLAMSGYAMLMFSAALLFLLAWRYLKYEKEVIAPDQTPSLTWVLHSYGFEILIVSASLMLIVIGFRLLRSAGKGTATVIPPEERQLLNPLIRDAKKDAIEQYVVLSSLSGFTGTFQKLGFTGLPLATAGLTLIFSIFAFKDSAFLELAKLTLGAFIGSFVQKGRESLTSKSSGPPSSAAD